MKTITPQNFCLSTYLVTPSKARYYFTPINRAYANLSGSQTNQDFTGTTEFTMTINYGYNNVGALSGVGTNLIAGDQSTNVINSLAFRGSGALKSLNYGNGRRLTMGYDANRQQPTSMVVDRTNGTDKIIDYAYQYYDQNGHNNGRIRTITDNYDPAYTTNYSYDDYNRLGGASNGVYSRSYTHDPWGNITNFSGSRSITRRMGVGRPQPTGSRATAREGRSGMTTRAI